MLELKDVMISYKNVPTVEHFSMHMEQGQIISLVGESGSGKTTVIRAILGLLPGGGKVTAERSRLRASIFWLITQRNGESFAVLTFL